MINAWNNLLCWLVETRALESFKYQLDTATELVRKQKIEIVRSGGRKRKNKQQQISKESATGLNSLHHLHLTSPFKSTQQNMQRNKSVILFPK